MISITEAVKIIERETVALPAETIGLENSIGRVLAENIRADMDLPPFDRSQMDGFAVDSKSLPKGVEETHISLFDGSNCGLQLTGKPVFSVQYHPEASPGPQDSHYLFDRFVGAMRTAKAG